MKKSQNVCENKIISHLYQNHLNFHLSNSAIHTSWWRLYWWQNTCGLLYASLISPAPTMLYEQIWNKIHSLPQTPAIKRREITLLHFTMWNINRQNISHKNANSYCNPMYSPRKIQYLNHISAITNPLLALIQKFPIFSICFVRYFQMNPYFHHFTHNIPHSLPSAMRTQPRKARWSCRDFQMTFWSSRSLQLLKLNRILRCISQTSTEVECVVAKEHSNYAIPNHTAHFMRFEFTILWIFLCNFTPQRIFHLIHNSCFFTRLHFS